MLELALFIWVAFGIASAVIGSSRGARGNLRLGLLLFGPFGLPFAFALGSGRECPECRKNVHEQATRCPYCQGDLPAVQPGDSRGFMAPVAKPERIKCPDCAELIRSDARKCRFCGFILWRGAAAGK